MSTQWTTWRNYAFTASRILAHADHDLRAHIDLSLSDFDVLATLETAENHTLSMSCLSATVLVTHSGLSRSVSRLVSRGLIEKLDDQDDRRQRLVRLTPRGRDVLGEAAQRHRELVTELFFNALSPNDLAGMSVGLAHLADHVK